MRSRWWLIGLCIVLESPTVGLASSFLQNLSQGKLATQSSTMFGLGASFAVDGNTSGSNGFTHTSLDTEPWWDVDLGALYFLGNVTVWNRLDCCGDRLDGFSVFVSDQPFASNAIAAARSQPGVSEYKPSGAAGTSRQVQANRTGRYVRVQLPWTSYLHVNEVQVWGDPTALPPETPVTPPPSFSIGSGSYSSAQSVAISAAGAGSERVNTGETPRVGV